MDSSTPPGSASTSPNAILLPTFAALAIVANYVPLRLLLRVKKVAASTLVIVLMIQNAFSFINAIIWPNDNVETWFSGVGLCDVEVAIRSPVSTLLTSCSAYISWDLAKALDTDNPRTLHEPRKARRRRIAIELIFCFAIPVLQIPLQYIVQMNRYAIVTVFGCTSFVDNSWPTVVIIAIWPSIFALLNAYFAIVVIARLRKHRGVLSRTLSSTGSGLNARRFVKLFFLSGSILVIYLPITIYLLFVNVNFTYRAYSWALVHDPAYWNLVAHLTSDMEPIGPFMGWISVIMSIILILLYGLNRDGREIYKGWLLRIGFGKIFPRLLEPRELPMHWRGSESRSSWIRRFDMVSRVIHHYDEDKKGSHATTSQTMTPRKGSGTTFGHTISPIKSTSTATADLEFLTPSSSTSQAVMTPALVLPRPEPVYQTPLFSSPFRTHTNLPYILFSSKTSTTNTPSENTGPQRQKQNIATSVVPTSSIETTIWSSSDLDDDDLDPLAPRMGTRAYRERERRLHQQEREAHIGMIPDTVTVDFSASRTSKDEIKVERKLERIEELAHPPRSSSS